VCRKRYPLFEGGIDGHKTDSNGKQIGVINPIWNFKQNNGGGYICWRCTEKTTNKTKQKKGTA
jgi:hypothetical protein